MTSSELSDILVDVSKEAILDNLVHIDIEPSFTSSTQSDINKMIDQIGYLEIMLKQVKEYVDDLSNFEKNQFYKDSFDDLRDSIFNLISEILDASKERVKFALLKAFESFKKIPKFLSYTDKKRVQMCIAMIQAYIKNLKNILNKLKSSNQILNKSDLDDKLRKKIKIEE
ncbi:hypothetical protein P618_200069 [Holospora obtusa F1]|uniref:Uncharacterized protein n=1 Tax=Holospora obtusa F1 TaxID=1399147 RepID=W6TFE0_HOLOB|nr:hypothetical protein [Holospora obtusa]ETZ07726.1 hypothetical protein P618_200069 [Holospora obtusa F1]